MPVNMTREPGLQHEGGLYTDTCEHESRTNGYSETQHKKRLAVYSVDPCIFLDRPKFLRDRSNNSDRPQILQVAPAVRLSFGVAHVQD